MNELCRLYAEYDSVETAELAAGRIRRAVRGIRRMTIYRLSKHHQPVGGRIRFTMLPVNLRMTNYATDVLYSEVSTRAIPEPYFRQETELMILCEEKAVKPIVTLLHATGAMRVRNG